MDIDDEIIAKLKAMRDERKTPVEMLEWLVEEFQKDSPKYKSAKFACVFAFRQAFNISIKDGMLIMGWTRFGWGINDTMLNEELGSVIYK